MSQNSLQIERRSNYEQTTSERVDDHSNNDEYFERLYRDGLAIDLGTGQVFNLRDYLNGFEHTNLNSRNELNDIKNLYTIDEAGLGIDLESGQLVNVQDQLNDAEATWHRSP